MRTYLTANADFYVAASGSDATGDGSAANPWATVTHAYAYAQRNLDLAGWTVTVYVQADMTAAWTFDGPLVGARGAQSFVVRGTGNNQNTTVTSSSGANVFFISNGAAVRTQYLAIQPASNGGGWCVTDGTFEFGNVNINVAGGAVSNAVGPRSIVRAVGVCTLVGVSACRNVFVSEDNAQTELPQTFYIAGAPTWTGAFVQGDLGGMIDGTGFSYVGGYPTGPRYTAAIGGIVFTGAAAGSSNPSFFPGSSAGTSTGGYYQ